MQLASDYNPVNRKERVPFRSFPEVVSCIFLSSFLLLMPAALSSDEGQQDRQRGWPCASKIDPSYILIAEGTGGQVQMFQPSESSGSLILMESQLSGNDETVFRASGEMNGEKQFTVDVDPSIESITFSSFVQCMKMITYLDPSGHEVMAGMPNLEDHRFISGRILTVQNPEKGTWHVSAAGSGYFSVIADAKTDLRFTARFVEPGGRPGHKGYFPIERMPHPGVKETLSAELSERVRDIKILLVDRETTPIQKLDLAVVEGSEAEYLGPVILKAETFRIMVEGTDMNGVRFQRTLPPLFTLQKPSK